MDSLKILLVLFTTVFIVILGVVGLWFLWQYPASITYSKGTRAGLLNKFSEKGLIIKNWCGEIEVGVTSGAYNPNTYTITIGIDRKKNDQELIKNITDLVGEQVEVTYEQKAFGGHSLLGCSDYLVTSVKKFNK